MVGIRRVSSNVSSEKLEREKKGQIRDEYSKELCQDRERLKESKVS